MTAALPSTARAVRLAAVPGGLPAPEHFAAAEFDLNRDEDISYARRLLPARVPAEPHQWPGTFRGSQAILSAEISQGSSPAPPRPCAGPWPSKGATGCASVPGWPRTCLSRAPRATRCRGQPVQVGSPT